MKKYITGLTLLYIAVAVTQLIRQQRQFKKEREWERNEIYINNLRLFDEYMKDPLGAAKRSATDRTWVGYDALSKDIGDEVQKARDES